LLIIANFEKQPSDVLDYDIDCSSWLTQGDNVQSVAASPDDGSLSIDSVVNNDPRVKLWISGGVDGKTYKVTVGITTVDGRHKEVEFLILVRDS
jgi:hypothetical protein